MSAGRQLTIVYDDVFLLHGVAGHAERPERLRSVVTRLRGDERLAGVPWSDADGADADLALLTTVHSERHVRQVAAMSSSGSGWIDTDTYCTPESFRVATRAAGATAWAARLVGGGTSAHALALVRPPGHHATAGAAMGFCLFNNAALAVRALQRYDGITRVAVIDIDVHHGNGTQDVFYADPYVLYASVHQYPFYPGTGGRSEIGCGAGAGSTINVPLAAGTTGEQWLAAFAERIEPAVITFAPGAIVVSAGYDGHEDDPLAELLLTTATYREVTRRIRGIATHLAIPTLWVLEGGYNLEALAESIAATAHELNREDG